MSPTLWTYVWIGIGSAIGGIARFALSDWTHRWGSHLPWGTLIVNVTGSFLIGFIFALMDNEGRKLISPAVGTFLMTGICGGYTTFSAFSLQTLLLFRSGLHAWALANIGLSILVCLVATWLGVLLGSLLSR